MAAPARPPLPAVWPCDYEDDNFKGVISAVYDGDAVIEVYVDEDNSVITDRDRG